MNKREITVFLSGTREDLRPYWCVARSTIDSIEGYRALMMEDAGAQDFSPDRWSTRAATTPDLFVSLVGVRYGKVPRRQKISLTEQEYDTAKRVGIPRLLFLTDSWDPEYKPTQTKTAAQRLRRFRRKIATDRMYAKVDSPGRFEKELRKAIATWERDTLRGATTSAEEYYRPWLQADRDYGHQLPLVGRQDTLEALLELQTSERRVLVLSSPWGVGKSRLLLETARQSSTRMRFLREEVVLTREALNVSAVDDCVLVMEDLHRRDSQEVLRFLSFLRRFNAGVKLVATTRPGHVDGFLEGLRTSGFSPPEVDRIELAPLSDTEHRALIARALGEEGEAAHIISSRTVGSTLAGILTARLFRRKRVTLGQIEEGDEFRSSVLLAFKQAFLEQIGDRDREEHEGVLRTVALCGPLRWGDDDDIAGLASFLDITPDAFRRVLGNLEDAGIVIRRGDLIRIPVDAIAEATLREATARGAESLGYAERAAKELWPTLARNTLTNLGAVNASLREEGIRLDLLAAHWSRLLPTYEAADEASRNRLLEALEGTAPYEPERMLAMVRFALDHPDEAERSRYSKEIRGDRLSSLLEGPLYYPEHLGAACDLLWTLARDEARDRNQRPKSAERMLTEVGQYKLRRPPALHEAFVEWASRRLTGANAIPGDRLAAYLKPVLGREASHEWSDGLSIHMSAGGILASVAGPIRERALDILESMARTQDLGAAAAAIDGIGLAFSLVLGAFGREVTPTELAQWHPEELDGIERLSRLRDFRRSRVLDLCILHEIQWSAEHSSHIELKKRAQAMLQVIRASLAGSLEASMVPWWFYDGYGEATRGGTHAGEIRETAEKKAGGDASVLIAEVEHVFGDMTAAGLKPDPTALLVEIARVDRDLGMALLEFALTDPGSAIAGSVVAMAIAVAEKDRAGAAAWVRRAVDSADPRLMRMVGWLLRFPEGLSVFGEGVAVEYLQRLLTNPDLNVRESALTALSFGPLPESKRIELLSTYDVSSAPSTGEAWAQAIIAGRKIDGWPDADLERVAGQLRYSQKFDHWSYELVEALSTRVGSALVDSLLARVKEASGDGFKAGFRPVNSAPLRSLPLEERVRCLSQLGQLLDSDSPWVCHAAGKLFVELARGHHNVMHDVRMRWATSQGRELILRAARSMREQGPEVVLEEADIVAALLRGSKEHGDDFLRDIRSVLLAAAMGGVRRSVGDADSPTDVWMEQEAARLGRTYPEGSLERSFYLGVAEATRGRMEFMRERREERT